MMAKMIRKEEDVISNERLRNGLKRDQKGVQKRRAQELKHPYVTSQNAANITSNVNTTLK
jgi:hypothetical protein